MDYVSVRDLGDNPDEIGKRVAAGEEFVVTRNGRPFALLVPTRPEDVEKHLRTLRAARFGAAFERLQAQARASGADQLTDADIQAEIDAVRAERRRPASDP
ncbi:MAG TPA: type II toxin-antitoxin system Phd/YefM family antitoxin [Rubrivivax sp.]|nr:type II toxin-antitoxin system Phd/YefM family antitoxin [Rubrivivax sp.]